MLGLQTDKQDETILNMVANFSDLIDTYGFIPNGNRTYYLSRSQPPFYASMIELLSEIKGNSIYSKYLKHLETEYYFWMNGADKLDNENNAIQHVVSLNEGEILNRYYDSKNTPRSEMYRADIVTANQAIKNTPDCAKESVFRNLRSAAESGWDFSSRWLADTANLFTIQTTDIIPVDLNSLLYNLELTISKAYQINNDLSKAKTFKDKSENRRKTIIKYCWNQDKGFFMDYNFKQKKQSVIFSLAGVYPMFFKIATNEQAFLIAEKVENSFLQRGGVVATLTSNKINQQWDSPNGWAPLQWITIKGLRNYGKNYLANKIKIRWLSLNKAVYTKTHKMFEKYDVVELKDTGGGEYPNQDGFGWTNGVYQRLSKEKPDNY
jgi:alpha,alpha-trehalase